MRIVWRGQPSIKNHRIYPRRGTFAEFDTAAPLLADGELAVMTDRNWILIGDGVTAWEDLTAATPTEVYNLILESVKG